MTPTVATPKTRQTLHFRTSGPLRPAVFQEVTTETVDANPWESWSAYTYVRGLEKGVGELVDLTIRHPLAGEAWPSRGYGVCIQLCRGQGTKVLGTYESLETAVWNAARIIANH